MRYLLWSFDLRRPLYDAGLFTYEQAVAVAGRIGNGWVGIIEMPYLIGQAA